MIKLKKNSQIDVLAQNKSESFQNVYWIALILIEQDINIIYRKRALLDNAVNVIQIKSEKLCFLFTQSNVHWQ